MIEQFLIRQSVLGSVTNMLLSAGTLSSNRSDVTFADSNGVSFGLNTNGVITATVQTNYLTTAMASNRGSDFVQATAGFFGTNASGTIASNAISVSVAAGGGGAGSVNISAGTTSIVSTAFTFSNSNGVSFGINTNAVITATVVTTYAGQGFTTATTAGTAIVGTLSTNGLSMGVPAYLTTAMQSNAATISNINISAGTTSTNASAFTFSNSNNVSFGINGQTITGSIATTYAGTGFTTATTAGTNIVGTLNTSGLSLGVPAYLTTAALSQDSSKYAGTGFTTTSTAGSNIVGTLATNGLSMGVPNYLTTAMQSNAATISNIKISAGTLSQTRSDVTFADSNGISWGLNTNGVVTGSIATTYAGTGFTSTTTAGTAIVGTLNTSGLSLGVPAFLTTAALSQDSSKYAGTNSAITGGSLTVNTSGISINIPIATLSFYANQDNVVGPPTSSAPGGGQSLQIQPFILPQPCSFGFVRWLASFSLASASQTGTSVNTSFTMNRTFSNAIVLMSQGTGANSLSLQYSTSTLGSWVYQTSLSAAAVGSQYTVTYNITYPTQGTTSQYTTSYATSTGQYEFNTTILSLFSGGRFVDIGFSTLLTPGNYWMALGSSSAFASNAGPANLSSASVGMNSVFITQHAVQYGFPGIVVNASNCMVPGLGSFSSGAKLISTSSIGLGSISMDNALNKILYFQFLRYA